MPDLEFIKKNWMSLVLAGIIIVYGLRGTIGVELPVEREVKALQTGVAQYQVYQTGKIIEMERARLQTDINSIKAQLTILQAVLTNIKVMLTDEALREEQRDALVIQKNLLEGELAIAERSLQTVREQADANQIDPSTIKFN